MSRPAVFLDRDGTLIEDPGYLSDPTGVTVLPGVPRALRRLSETGFALVVISNQAGVARGMFGEEDVRAVNDRLAAILEAQGAAPERWYWCPHHPEFTGPCSCRKPAAGLLERAAEELDLDLGASWMVGDHSTDVEAGRRAGGSGILVLTGHGTRHDVASGVPVAADLPSAVEIILGSLRTKAGRIHTVQGDELHGRNHR